MQRLLCQKCGSTNIYIRAGNIKVCAKCGWEDHSEHIPIYRLECERCHMSNGRARKRLSANPVWFCVKCGHTTKLSPADPLLIEYIKMRRAISTKYAVKIRHIQQVARVIHAAGKGKRLEAPYMKEVKKDGED